MGASIDAEDDDLETTRKMAASRSPAVGARVAKTISFEGAFALA